MNQVKNLCFQMLADFGEIPLWKVVTLNIINFFSPELSY